LATARASSAATATTGLLPSVIGQEQAGKGREDNDGVLETAEHELMDAGDIEDDRTDDDEAEATEARQDEEQTTSDFQNLHELKVTGAVHGTDEGRCCGTFWRLRDRDEVEEKVQSVNDEDRAEEGGDDVSGEFHGGVMGLDGET
jgi:hypothetical protein